MPTGKRPSRLRWASIGLLAGLNVSPIAARAQDSRWDALLSNSYWYVPVPNLIAYAAGDKSFNTSPPTPIGDQTLWALGMATNGVFTGQSTESFDLSGMITNSSRTMQGVVTPSGQSFVVFTPTDGGTSTIGIGQMRRINGLELMEMQTITGSG